MNSNSDSAIYEYFAEVYDATMQGVPFYQWAYTIFSIAQEYALSVSSRVADLGCGTGIVTRHLASYFENILALDRSPAMLKKAVEKNANLLSGKIHFIAGDFVSLPFKKGMLDLVVSTHDSINYITEKKNLSRHFKEVHRVLSENGIYIFDITSEKNVEKNFHKNTFKETYHNLFFVWENIYKKNERMIESYLRFYEVKNRFAKKIYWPNSKKFICEEIHRQKVYSHNEIVSSIDGLFTIEKVIADYQPEKDLEKANIIAYVVKKI